MPVVGPEQKCTGVSHGIYRSIMATVRILPAFPVLGASPLAPSHS